MKLEPTERGFDRADFVDGDGHRTSFQRTSNAPLGCI